MSARNRQLVMLTVLVTAFVVVLGRQFVPALGGAGVGGGLVRSAAGRSVNAVAGPMKIAQLRLDALEHKPATYTPGRDPFRFGPAPPKPPPPRPKPDRAAAEQAAQAKRQPERPAPRPQPPKPKPPAVEFVYLGSFGVPGREIAVFSDGKEILNAFAGDVLRKEFVVRSIGYESADIGFVNFPDAPAKRLAVGG